MKKAALKTLITLITGKQLCSSLFLNSVTGVQA